MQCSEEEALLRFFYNVSSSFFLIFFFLYYSFIFLANFLHFIGSYPLIYREQDGYDYNFVSDEEEEEVEEEEEEEEVEEYVNLQQYFHEDEEEDDHLLVADIIQGGESLKFYPQDQNQHVDEDINENYSTDQQFSVDDSSPCSESDVEVIDDEEESTPTTNCDDNPNHFGPTFPITTQQHKTYFVDNDSEGKDHQEIKDANFTKDENFLFYAPTRLESHKFSHGIEEKDDVEIFGDSCTVGSTSKSSSEWRSSINYTEDPFSSSSRRSCPKWESYTVFQKYDEEMMFLDRISAQKLHETESLKSIQVCPRSISERFVHKLTTINKRSSEYHHTNPYHELEATYVAQICLTWEALNWNYKNFERKRGSRKDFDPGCPASVAQQFQQFEVLLQRYIENEPYEQGRRPEIYARMRLLAPKLLLVPEYRDSEDDDKVEGFGSRISSASFLMIMEDGIRTFMDFLKADRENPCQILKSLFGRNRRRRKGSVDPSLLQLMKKVNSKKKTKVKDVKRAGKCIRRRKLKVEEEMEILMGLIDLKVVSRVLRMNDLREQQLHWCEEKMSKVKVLDGKLQRDSSTLFFPAH